MQMDRNIHRFLQFADERVSGRRQEQVRHILDTDDVCAHLDEVLCLLYEVFFVMYRARRIAQCRLACAAVFLNRTHRALHISYIVQRVENTNDIDAVLDHSSTEGLDHVVCIVTVSQKVLRAKKHLKRCLRHRFFQSAESLPRVFSEETHAGVKSRSTPALQGPVTHVIQDLTCRKHILDTHSRRRLRLMRITEDSIRYE